MNIYNLKLKITLLKIIIRINLLFFCFITNANDSGLKHASPDELGLSELKLDKIDQVFNKAIKNKEIPGAVIAISRYGKIAYFRAFGIQNPEKGITMKTNSIFRIYSMTKPIISVGAMILNENGSIYLNEPLEKYIPNFTNLKIAEEINNGDKIKEILVPAKSKINIHNLLTHTSGITYGVFGNSYAKRILKKSDIGKLNLESIYLEHYVNKLAEMPLAYSPGTTWEYGRSIEVLGRVIEVASNEPLDIFLNNKIFKPLKMKDTSFYVEENKWHRIAEPFKEKNPKLINKKNKPNFLTGGHGLTSTVSDYMRFCLMLLKQGTLDGKNILSKKTIEYMTSNHLGDNISRDEPYFLPGPGYGFGLGFAVRESEGLSSWMGSKGEYFWAGYAGTYFWIDPKEELVVVSMTQSVNNRMQYRMLLRNLVYQAIIN